MDQAPNHQRRHRRKCVIADPLVLVGRQLILGRSRRAIRLSEKVKYETFPSLNVSRTLTESGKCASRAAYGGQNESSLMAGGSACCLTQNIIVVQQWQWPHHPTQAKRDNRSNNKAARDKSWNEPRTVATARRMATNRTTNTYPCITAFAGLVTGNLASAGT